MSQTSFYSLIEYRLTYFLHDYGKAARPGRKLGHITVLAGDMAALDRRIADIESMLND
jgi:phosphoribosylaminoimidazole carboxylase (NCAIR synthetase)